MWGIEISQLLKYFQATSRLIDLKSALGIGEIFAEPPLNFTSVHFFDLFFLSVLSLWGRHWMFWAIYLWSRFYKLCILNLGLWNRLNRYFTRATKKPLVCGISPFGSRLGCFISGTNAKSKTLPPESMRKGKNRERAKLKRSWTVGEELAFIAQLKELSRALPVCYSLNT